MEHVKDYVSVGAGLAAIVGSLVTAAALFLSGGDSNPPTAQANEPTATATATLVPPTATPSPTDTPAPTSTPAPAGEFLRVQFGTQQDPATLLPAGTTATPGDTLAVCAGGTLFAWVYHSFAPGAVIDGRISDRAGVLFNASVAVAPGATHFWISALVATTGQHTLSVALQGSEVGGEWSIEVTCG